MSTVTAARHADASTITDPRRRRLVMAAVCAALVAVVAGVSGLNVAQQAIALDLGASQSQILWAINGYTVALAALLMPVGAIGDRWGRKPVLLGGLGVFALGNVVAALANNPELLISGRVIAGAGAAMVMPVTLSVITASFPEEARGSAVGVWAGFAGVGGIIGLLTSAVIIDDLTWPWLFVLPVAMAVVAGLLTFAVVPNSQERGPGRFDVAGSVLSVLAVGGIVLGIHEGPERGWTDPLAAAGLAIGIVGLVGFIAWELRTAHPLLDVRVFANRALSAGILALATVFGIMFGIFLTLMQFMQAVLGYSAIRGAVGLLPMALVMMSLSPLAPKVSRRVGLRNMLVAGALLVGLGLVVMAELVDTSNYWSIVPGLMLTAVGLAATMTPATTAITESLSRGQQGVASALNDTSREIGGALGIALMGSLFNSQYRAQIGDVASSLDPTQGRLVEEGIAGATKVAQGMGQDGLPILTAAREALVDAWASSMWIGAGIAVVAAGLVIALSLGKKGKQDMAGHGVLDTDEAADTTATEADADTREPALVGG
ncbi:MAG TPA: DHA2 family efflux MFS transporter permease subunit [Acidimicrobiales bacterium]|nr:DHA2 family efflux MFS transporter permease subunit [Acidimicrobiales bacterium]